MRIVRVVAKWNWRMKMSKKEMEKMLDDVFRKVFGEVW